MNNCLSSMKEEVNTLLGGSEVKSNHLMAGKAREVDIKMGGVAGELREQRVEQVFGFQGCRRLFHTWQGAERLLRSVVEQLAQEMDLVRVEKRA